MVVVVFRARLKAGIGKDYEETDARMATLSVAAWRKHPEHREAQRLGRERWFTEYRITVCDAVRDYSFKA